jgi:hypothetical protein
LRGFAPCPFEAFRAEVTPPETSRRNARGRAEKPYEINAEEY